MDAEPQAAAGDEGADARADNAGGIGASEVRRRAVAAGGRRRQRNEEGGRSRVRQVKLTEEEDAQLVARAERAGMSVPRWLVECGLSSDPGVTREERREFLTHLMGAERLLANVANNVNQIAVGVNATGRTSHDLRAVAGECDRLLRRVGFAIEGIGRW